jgi:hypothetical protein
MDQRIRRPKRKVDRSPLIPGEAELLARIKKKMDLQKSR